MKFLAVDLGLSRTGIAISDDLEMMAIPLKTIRQKNKDRLLNEISELVEVYNIDKIILGLPVNMDGSEGFAAQRTYNFCELLKTLNIKLSLVDERLSSVEAQKILLANGKHAKDIKDKVDMQAAAIILETYIRSKNAG